MAINDETLDGYYLDTTAAIFLRSEVGIGVWSERTGQYLRFKGNGEARLIQSDAGPMVEISMEESGKMVRKLCIPCIDLMAMTPGADSGGNLELYRSMVAAVRARRLLH